MRRLGEIFARLAERFLPDPMVLAVLLTLFVMAAAMIHSPSAEISSQAAASRVLSLAGIWLSSVWDPGFLAFALQMCVILLTGFGLARAPIVLRGLRRIARWPKTNRGAVWLIALVSCAGCWINWGFGLILAGVLSLELRREFRRRGIRCQYALIVAAAYCGMMIWHGGLSGSAPLKIASEGVVVASQHSGGETTERIEPVDVRRTIFSGANLGLSVGLLLAVPLLFRTMAAGGDATHDHDTGIDSIPDQATAAEQIKSARASRALADVLNESRVLPIALSILLLGGLAYQLHDKSVGAINLNFVNSVFLCAGLALHRSVMAYVSAVLEGGRAIVGIVLQFPLYAGISGLMSQTGWAAAISGWFVGGAQSVAAALGVAPAGTFPVATFFSAAIVNFFVPSGGGQWIVQGPIMCGAARSLGLPIGQTVMAIAYGDQLTNMVQPFWAIPLMGMTQVNVRKFMGYCALLMLLATPVFVVGLWLY